MDQDKDTTKRKDQEEGGGAQEEEHLTDDGEDTKHDVDFGGIVNSMLRGPCNAKDGQV